MAQKYAHVLDGKVTETWTQPDPETVEVIGEDGETRTVTHEFTVENTWPNAEEWHACGDEVEAGWVQGENGFAAPPAPEPQPRTHFTSLEFMELFTEDEQVGIFTSAVPAVIVWRGKAGMAQVIDTTDQRTKDGIHALVGAGLLSAERAVAILAGEPASSGS